MSFWRTRSAPDSPSENKAAIDFRREPHQIVRNLDWINGVGLKPAQRFGQPREFAHGALADIVERWRRRDAPSFFHHLMEKCLAPSGIGHARFEREQVALAETMLGVMHQEVVGHAAAKPLMPAARIEAQQVVAIGLHVRGP